MQIRSTGCSSSSKESEVVQCSWLEDLQHSIEKPRESQGGGEGRRYRRIARSEGRWWEGKGRRYIMSRWGIRGLESRVGRKCSISRRGSQIPQWRYPCRRSPRRGSHSVTTEGAAPRMSAAKSSEFG